MVDSVQQRSTAITESTGEIEQFDVVPLAGHIRQKDVFRLQVPVDHPLAVRLVERLQDLLGDVDDA